MYDRFDQQQYAGKCLICGTFTFYFGLYLPPERIKDITELELPNDSKESRYKLLAKEIKKLTGKLKFNVRKEYEHDEITIKRVTETYENLAKLTAIPSVYTSRVDYAKDCARLIGYLGQYHNDAYFDIGLAILNQMIYT